MHVAIRADGSHDIGLGHLYRTAVVAREAHRRGHDVTFVTRTPESARDVVPASSTIAPLPASGVAEAAVDWIERAHPDAVVTDSTAVDTAYQQHLRETGVPVTVIADDARHTVCADVVVNGNLYGPQVEYEWVDPEPTWCLGTEYLLLRDPFRSIARECRSFPEEPSSLLITMGGVDKANRTPTAMAALARFDLPVTVVVGPGFENAEEIRRAAADLGGQFTLRNDPEDLPELFLEANVAVSTLGTTTYELLATQTPIVGIPDNETPIDTALEAADAAIVLSNRPSADEISDAVSRVLSDRDLRRRLWEAGSGLVTGRGAKKVVDAVEQSVSAAHSP